MVAQNLAFNQAGSAMICAVASRIVSDTDSYDRWFEAAYLRYDESVAEIYGDSIADPPRSTAFREEDEANPDPAMPQFTMEWVRNFVAEGQEKYGMTENELKAIVVDQAIAVADERNDPTILDALDLKYFAASERQELVKAKDDIWEQMVARERYAADQAAGPEVVSSVHLDALGVEELVVNYMELALLSQDTIVGLLMGRAEALAESLLYASPVEVYVAMGNLGQIGSRNFEDQRLMFTKFKASLFLGSEICE